MGSEPRKPSKLEDSLQLCTPTPVWVTLPYLELFLPCVFPITVPLHFGGFPESGMRRQNLCCLILSDATHRKV
jgi:hypothetical protein